MTSFTVVPEMKMPSLIAAASLGLIGLTAARGADATAPVDYTQRSTPYNPSATVTPDKKELVRDETLQEKRVEKTTVDKKLSTVGDRRAAISIEETREKNVREKNSKPPAKVEQPMSGYNGREASMATATDTKRPPTVSKYQDRMTAASTSNMAKYPAMDGATAAKINRFVYMKNPDPSSPATTTTGAATPAGGVNPVRN